MGSEKTILQPPLSIMGKKKNFLANTASPFYVVLRKNKLNVYLFGKIKATQFHSYYDIHKKERLQLLFYFMSVCYILLQFSYFLLLANKCHENTIWKT